MRLCSISSKIGRSTLSQPQWPGAGREPQTVSPTRPRHRNQLYGWRREFAAVANAMAEARAHGPGFVPVVADDGSGAAVIEIEIGSAIVRVRAGVELGLLGKVLRLLKAMR